MDEKNENKNEKKSKKKRVLILVILLLLLLIPALIFLGNLNKPSDVSKNDETNNEKSDSNIQLDEVQGGDEPDKDTQENLTDADSEVQKEEMVSENYRVSQVKFGGNAVVENGNSRDIKLEIYQVKSENIISQEDNEPRILISWKTNKEAVSSVDYARGDGKNSVSIAEEGYGFEHTMLLENMEFSTIYTYRIEARDKWANKVSTEYFSAYTGDKSESIFDLITNAVEDVFGWAM